MSIAINKIVNANVYLDGNAQTGRAASVKAPDLEIETIDHKGLGLVGTISLPAGVAALSGSIEWDGFYPDVFAKSYNPFSFVQLMLRSNLQVFNSAGLAAEQAMVTIMNVMFAKSPLGDHKPKESTGFTSEVKIHSIKQMVAGRELLFYDVFSNQFRVGGKDVLVNYRKNIGA